MPTNRKRRGHQRVVCELSPVACRFFLDASTPEDLQGWEWKLLSWGLRNYVTGTHPTELWAEYGGELIRDFAEMHPGKRQSYFWEHVAVEKRIELELPAQLSRKKSKTYHAPPRLFESQAAYLKRLDLLLAGEECRLTKKDFEPEIVVAEIECYD